MSEETDASGAGYAGALLARLAADPGAIVIRRRGQSISAGALLDRAGLAADEIAAHLPPGTHPRIGLMLHDNLETIGFALGCWLLGAEVHYLDYRIPAAEMPALAARDGCALVITRRAPVTPGFLVTRGADPATAMPDALAAARRRVAAALQTGLPGSLPAEIATSSGVSGPPRFYPVSQAQLLQGSRTFARNGNRGAWGVALVAMNICFGGARLVCWRNLLAGRLLILLDLLFSTAELDRALLDPGVEECSLPPVLIRALLRQHQGGAAPRYPHLKKLQSIGGPSSAEERLAAWHLLSRQFTVTYSSTETGVIARLEGEDLLRFPASCGRPLPGRMVAILGPDGAALPPGETGTIEVTLPRGHRAVPGDRGWLDAAGYLYIAGRSEGIICRKGESFSAAVLEENLLRDDGLLDAAVLVLPGASGDDGIVFALHPAAGIDRAALQARLVARLPGLRRPDAVLFTTAGDITPGGKIRRARMMARHLGSGDG